MSKKEDLAIAFEATFKKAQTSVDGGWVLSLDLSEKDSKVISEIAALKDVVLQVVIIPEI